MNSRRNKILIIGSIVVSILLVIGGIFLIKGSWGNSDSNNNPPPSQGGSGGSDSSNSLRAEKNTTITEISNALSQAQQVLEQELENMNQSWKNDIQNATDSAQITTIKNRVLEDIKQKREGKDPGMPPPPQDDNKIEIKVFWSGQLWFEDDWKDYWIFSEAKEGKWMLPGNKRFLISKKTPILVDKDLWQEDLIFTLAYSKDQGSKVEKTHKDGYAILTKVENNFTLTPLLPTKDDPDFLNRWENTKSKEVYFDYSKYSGGDYIFIDNQIQEGKPEKDLDKYVFHPENPSIKELLVKNHLQVQNSRSDKEFRIFYLERDIEKRIFHGNSTTYYFNDGAKVKTAAARP